MVVQITHQTQLDAADKFSEFTQTEFFEATGLPEKPVVIEKLKEMSILRKRPS